MSVNEMLMAAAGSAGAANEYVEDCFATHLYTGNGSTQTITNGIDLAGEGGLVWSKYRTSTFAHVLIDTVRGGTGSCVLRSNTTGAAGAGNQTNIITPFNSNGYTIATDWSELNESSASYVSWTFREQPKFFDVVTYTGNGSNRTISHNLGSVPGMIIIKRTDTTADWQVYHRSLANTEYLVLNTTAAKATGTTRWNSTTPTSTVFSLGTDATVNANNGTYVAYLFAHDAGGFGEAGTDNIISCGSFTTDGSGNATVSLGYEPQYLLYKRSDSTGSWKIADNMRGISDTGSNGSLNLVYANASNAGFAENGPKLTPTGFSSASEFIASATYIYMAIRRPMKPPTSGTEVFQPYVTASASNIGSTSGTLYNTGIVTDWAWLRNKSNTAGWYLGTRLTGARNLISQTTAAEGADGNMVWDSNRGAVGHITDYGLFAFRRAPKFFDIVCYTGTGVARTVAHNLGVAPELMIVKRRDVAADNWCVYSVSTGNTKYMYLNTNAAAATFNLWNDTTPTASVFSVSSGVQVNASGGTYVAYLFASLNGISKVGSYTGNGSSQTINCGFTGGARFVLIKRTDSTGNWVTFDSARGIVSGNDPALYLNSTAAEVTTIDGIDPDSSGFVVNQESTLNLNVNGASYIYLSIS